MYVEMQHQTPQIEMLKGLTIFKLYICPLFVTVTVLVYKIILFLHVCIIYSVYD